MSSELLKILGITILIFYGHFLDLHFYITYFLEYSISTFIWVCACTTCMYEPMCARRTRPWCTCMLLWKPEDMVSPHFVLCHSPPYSLEIGGAWNRDLEIGSLSSWVNLELTILTTLTCLSNSPSSAWPPPTHLPSLGMCHHAQHYLVHGYWVWGCSEFRSLCLSRWQFTL